MYSFTNFILLHEVHKLRGITMTEQNIRVLALGLIQRADGAMLLSPGFDSIKNEPFYRLLGGGVEFGETGSEALRREFMEELGLEVTVSPLLLTAENIFTFEGELGHQIMMMYQCAFTDESIYEQQTVPRIDGEPEAVWRTREDIMVERAKLYPAEVTELL